MLAALLAQAGTLKYWDFDVQVAPSLDLCRDVVQFDPQDETRVSDRNKSVKCHHVTTC